MAVQIFLRLLAARGLPEPVAEYRFHRTRRWRADFCWPEQKVILEIQGGIWTKGRHTRGKALLGEWQKLNTAAGMGYRFIFCQPTALNRIETLDYIENAIKYTPCNSSPNNSETVKSS